MRKFNAVLSMGILALFLIHAIAGSFQLTGIISGGSGVMQAVAWVMLAMIILHVIIGCKLTADTLKACKKSGTSYYKENKLFWLRRSSGFAIMIFILFHVLIFLGRDENGVYRLSYFGILQLISQILLVISIAVHVLTNIRPLMIAVGTKSYAKILIDVLFILSIILILSGIAFVIYYLRWNLV
ncbi:MAG: pilus assembly protein PilX [Oscillospiraceae bacterium]|nr:pilus assembly protein PilX [Oscillospiraceae bacterium]